VTVPEVLSLGEVTVHVEQSHFSVRTHESCLAVVALAAVNARCVCTGANRVCLVRRRRRLAVPLAYVDLVAGAFFCRSVGRSAVGVASGRRTYTALGRCGGPRWRAVVVWSCQRVSWSPFCVSDVI